MAADTPDDPATPSPAPLSDADVERAMREAEAVALAASGLGSGLLAQQPVADAALTVAVLKVCPVCATEYETAARFCPADGAALRPKGTDSLIGRVLADRYHILKRIGEGGMGRVYLGEHVKMNRQCAIKVMSPVLVNDHESAARFAREASNAARIIHPSVAAVFDYGESEGLVYLVMEYVDGEPLSRLLAREAPLSVERSLDLARQIADGLGAAHELGIVHRDLKPDNILISRTRVGREVAKVVDFGIAKAMQETAGEALTRTGLVIGTPEFMSPEQLLGDPVDARSDLYALGCILHLMLTAAPIFEAPTREQMIKRRLSEEGPHLRNLDPGLAESLDHVVARMLARAPSDRYGSAAEVRDALSGAHGRRPGADGHPSSPSRHTPRSMPTLSLEATASVANRVAVAPAPPRGRRVYFGVAAIVVLSVGSAIVARNSRARTPDARPAGRLDTAARVAPPAMIPSAAIARDSARIGPPTAAAGGAGTPVTMVDSARVRAQAAARLRRDSVRNAASSREGAVRAAIVRYAQAISSGDVSRLRASNPALTSTQQQFWENNFAIAEQIRAGVRYGPTTVQDSTAEAEFSLRLVFVNKSSKQEELMIIPQRATLVKRGGSWQLTGLR